MCTVEIPRTFFLLDVMRRVSHVGRGRPGRTRPPHAGVRRALFDGEVDHTITARDIQHETREMYRESRARWNFDFETETPLGGRFEWAPVSTRSSTQVEPENLELHTAESKPTPSNCTDTSEGPDTALVIPPSETETSRVSNTEKAGSSQKRKPIVQSKLTDFMHQRKRPASTIKSPSSSPAPKSKVRRTSTTTR